MVAVGSRYPSSWRKSSVSFLIPRICSVMVEIHSERFPDRNPFSFSLNRTKPARTAISTTANIYAHVIEEADQKNADILASVFLKKA